MKTPSGQFRLTLSIMLTTRMSATFQQADGQRTTVRLTIKPTNSTFVGPLFDERT